MPDLADSAARGRGALYGLAIGDALGMPTQLLPRGTVARLFPALDGFAPGPAENRISRGQPAGHVTDDTAQALIVAALLVDGDGRVDGRHLVERLLAWARQAEADGSEQLGPSSRRALEAVGRGLPLEEAGRSGDTNGAAMRIAPVGLATRPVPTDRLVERVQEVCRPTHNTGVAIAGAAAVAAAISAGLDGAPFVDATVEARRAAALGATRGYYAAGADVGARIAWAIDLVNGLDTGRALDAVVDLVGTGVATQEAVPAAFALAALWPDDPWQACLAAARLGGDSDTIGAITGAILGACCGIAAFPAAAVDTVRRVNRLDLDGLVGSLVALRSRA